MDESYKGKIGIITYWQHNYGSILQCYATCRIVRDLGYQPVVFSQTPEFLYRMYQKLLSWSRYIFYPKYRTTIDKLRNAPYKALKSTDELSAKRMHAFVERNIPSEEKTIAQWKAEAAGPAYVAFLSGSDQVWSGYRYTSVDNYFLRFAPRYKRIAWAPSFGTSDIADYNIRTYKKYIGQFRFLSAREKDGVHLIHQLTGRTCQQLIDPVYLLTKKEWEQLLEPIKNDCFVLCYFLDSPNDMTLQRINEYCITNSCNPWVIGNHGEWTRKLSNARAIACGPDEFVSLIHGANCVFTDSFHGVSFSLILHTPFFAFRRNYTHGTDQSSRVLSILQMCHFEDVYEPNTLVDATWDFTWSDLAIESKRREMLEYLDRSINQAVVESK